ncbi:MAG TPA: AI-2E family transporter [Methylococcaceae bacterium]|nr:AI-2E family transporter [Methylococcaceae bacterium]
MAEASSNNGVALEKWLRPLVPLLLLAGLLALTFLVLRNFLTPLVWAVILAYMTWPAHVRLNRLLGDKPNIGALSMTFVLFSAIVIPLLWFSTLLQSEVAIAYHALSELLSRKPELPEFLAKLPYAGAEIQKWFDQFAGDPAELRTRLLPLLRTLSGQLLQFAGDVGVNAAVLLLTLLSLFFLYRDGRQAIGQVKQVLHLVLGKRLQGYLAAAGDTVKAVVYGLVLTAIAQGSLAGLGYWFVGIKSPVLLSLVTMFFSLIPFGTPVVWVGASLWLLANGDKWAATELFLWGALVVSWVDNLVRPLVISGATRIPFLLVMFGVLGGLTTFGFVGLFLGPVILAVMLAVWREWLEEHDALHPPAVPLEEGDNRVPPV